MVAASNTSQKKLDNWVKNVEVLSDRMLVRINIPEKSKGGIVLPNASSQNPSAIVEGTVLKVGPGGWFDGKRLPMQCEAGDVVLFQQQQAMSIKIGEDFNRKEDGAIVILAEPFILTREPNR